mgnify:CR=1 FL=1
MTDEEIRMKTKEIGKMKNEEVSFKRVRAVLMYVTLSRITGPRFLSAGITTWVEECCRV